MFLGDTLMAAKRYKVVTCGGGTIQTTDFRKAFAWARNHSGPSGACRGSAVQRTRQSRTNPGHEVVVVCRNKVCKRTGWMESGAERLSGARKRKGRS